MIWRKRASGYLPLHRLAVEAKRWRSSLASFH